MAEGDSFTATRGWPGMRAAALTLLMCLPLGPGAILLGAFGHRPPATLASTDALGAIIDRCERAVAIVVGAAFSIFLVAALGRWLTWHSIELTPRELIYRISFLGRTSVVVIPRSDISAAAACADQEMSKSVLGQLHVTHGAGACEREARLVTRSYQAARALAAAIQGQGSGPRERPRGGSADR
jgi:hypothetical protein